MQKKGRDPEIAFQCYLDFLAGKTEVEIREEHHWALQLDAYGKVRSCKTAHRHIKEGEEIHDIKGRLREKAFDIKYIRQVRLNQRKRLKSLGILPGG